jgi:hypothetical protein
MMTANDSTEATHCTWHRLFIPDGSNDVPRYVVRDAPLPVGGAIARRAPSRVRDA